VVVAVVADKPAVRFRERLRFGFGLPTVVADDLRVGILDLHRGGSLAIGNADHS
jgi:hypothetical protein